MQTGPQSRLHALDAMRGTALLLGVFLHATMSFFPTDGVWFIMDANRATSLSVSFYVIHMFRMVTFFLLAGFFGRMMFHRLGATAFIKSRLKRIVLPLVVFWPVMMAAFIGLVIWSLIVQFGALPEDDAPPAWTWSTFPLTHLWFLYVLALFYAAGLMIRALVALVDRSGALRRAVDGVIRLAFRTPLAVVGLGALGALALVTHQGWIAWFGVPAPDYGVVPNTPALVFFGAAFTLGWLLQRQIDVVQSLKNTWLAYLAAAIALTVTCLVLVGPSPNFTVTLEGAQKLVYVAAYALGVWCWVFGLIGAALRFFADESPARRYIADSSYWVYLIHLPIVLALQIWVSPWSWPALLKYTFILGVSFPIMLLSYHVLVRRTFIGSMLNGLRKAPEDRAPAITVEVHTP